MMFDHHATQRLDHVHAHHQGRGWLLRFATTTAQRTTVSVARVFYTARGRPRASAVGLLQRSPGWTSCQLTQPTAVRSPRGSATDLRRPSIRPRYTMTQSLNVTRSGTDSQCNCCSSGAAAVSRGRNDGRRRSVALPRGERTADRLS